MGLETITEESTVDALNDSWPLAEDDLREADDHMRLIKTLLKRFYTEYKGRTKQDIGLGNVENYTAIDVISGAADNTYTTSAAIRTMFGTIKQTSTFVTLEEAMQSLDPGSLVSKAEQVGTNGPWRVYYYTLEL